MRSDLLVLLVFGSLATFRIAVLLTKENGPYHVFAKFRAWPKPKSMTREAISCPLCMSVYASAGFCGLFWLAGLRLDWPIWVVLWLSQSAVSVCLNQAFTKDV